MRLCQRGPSQRQCLELTAKTLVSSLSRCGISQSGTSPCGKVVEIVLCCFFSLCRWHGDLPWMVPWRGSPDLPGEASPKRRAAGRWTDLLHPPICVWENGFQVGFGQRPRCECASRKRGEANGWQIPNSKFTWSFWCRKETPFFFFFSPGQWEIRDCMPVEALQAN